MQGFLSFNRYLTTAQLFFCDTTQNFPRALNAPPGPRPPVGALRIRENRPAPGDTLIPGRVDRGRAHYLAERTRWEKISPLATRGRSTRLARTKMKTQTRTTSLMMTPVLSPHGHAPMRQIGTCTATRDTVSPQIVGRTMKARRLKSRQMDRNDKLDTVKIRL